MMRAWQPILIVAALVLFAPANAALAQTATNQQSSADSSSQEDARYHTEHIRGKVVWLADAIKRQHGIEIDEDAAESMVALETEDGQIIPLLKDARGRGFMMDKRIRNRPMELLVRRYDGLPVVQVLTVYTLHDGKKFELDYWCDICAISMYELKECECCQGASRLREREVGPSN